MKKHVMSITYPSKIEAVKSGKCRQTIRPLRRVSEGDSILLHGWSGAPYRSPWGWRMRVTVTEAIPVVLDYANGIREQLNGEPDHEWHKWGSMYATKLAELDFVAPPNGFELRDVLDGLNKSLTFVSGQIIRWSCD